ncbi:MAG TPA: carboxypeptidase regulatory-like domain-containing protein [Verrucomicrobiae bacterium]|nr:carboxypeptidase regulatory-like domain-containing protein [Verrucomicrobiae bacterium]
MTLAHKIEVWMVAVAVGVLAATLLVVRWEKRKPIVLRGAIMVQDSDPQKQLPIAGVLVSDDGLAESDAKTDASGLFVLKLRKSVRIGHPIGLHFRQPQYRPLDVNDFVSADLYVVHLVPKAASSGTDGQPAVKIANVRVRYTVKSMTEVNIGSAVKTFEIDNKGNVPCKGRHPCSPDGRWKAALGSGSLDAGVGNEFQEARVSCIAGPCPFTRIESDRRSQAGQVLTATARDWSDTATFLVEAEVFHPMESQLEHWTYPVIFAEGFSFTLPSGAQSVSIEADLDGQTIIFPLGPSLFLNWATCDTATNPDQGRVFRCALKPGFAFTKK